VGPVCAILRNGGLRNFWWIKRRQVIGPHNRGDAARLPGDAWCARWGRVTIMRWRVDGVTGKKSRKSLSAGARRCKVGYVCAPHPARRTPRDPRRTSHGARGTPPAEACAVLKKSFVRFAAFAAFGHFAVSAGRAPSQQQLVAANHPQTRRTPHPARRTPPAAARLRTPALSCRKPSCASRPSRSSGTSP
jgi:hypothetical protein